MIPDAEAKHLVRLYLRAKRFVRRGKALRRGKAGAGVGWNTPHRGATWRRVPVSWGDPQ